jgi:AraC family transcriptional regulator
MIARLNHERLDTNLFCREQVYWVDLCLTPRRPPALARYCDFWGPNRFVEMGSIIAFPPGKRLELRSSGGRHGSLICQINAGAIEKWFPDEFSWTERRLEAALNISSEPIQALLLRLNHELRGPSPGSGELCTAVMAQLAIELSRYFSSASDADEKGGLAAWRQRLIDERIADRTEPFPCVAELASHCRMSTRQLSRAFRVSRGCSLSNFLSRSCIEMAKRQLCTQESIREIANQLGFSSQSSFTAAFRRSTGTTPNVFRQRISVGRDR